MNQTSIMKRIHTFAAQNNRPVDAFIVLTDRCHLRCNMCYLVEHPRPELSTQTLIGVLEQLHDMGTMFATFTGGEPLLRSDCYDLLDYARSLGMMTVLYTTATPCNAERVAKLKDVGLFRASVSLYAAEPEIHDNVTQIPGSFQKTLEGCKRLLDAGIRVQLKFLQMGSNIGQLIPTYELASTMGAGFSFNFSLTACHDERRESLSLQLDEAMMTQVHRQMMYAFPDSLGRIEPKYVDPDASSCAVGRSRIVIGVDGSIYPCMDFTDSWGNLNEQPIIDIWNSVHAEPIRKLKRFADPICRVCPDRAFCFRCPASISLDTGDPDSPSENTCMIARAKRKVYEEKQAGILEESLLQHASVLPSISKSSRQPTSASGCSGCGSAQKAIEDLLKQPSMFDSTRKR